VMILLVSPVEISWNRAANANVLEYRRRIGPYIQLGSGFGFWCSHTGVFRQESASCSRSTGFPPTMWDSMISSTSVSVTWPYQTASG